MAYSIPDSLMPLLLGVTFVVVPSLLLPASLHRITKAVHSLRLGASLGTGLAAGAIAYACIGPSLVSDRYIPIALIGGALGGAAAWFRWTPDNSAISLDENSAAPLLRSESPARAINTWLVMPIRALQVRMHDSAARVHDPTGGFLASPAKQRILPALLAFLLAVLPLVVWTVARELSVIDDAMNAKAARADRRRWLAPWDPEAHLALAWATLRRNNSGKSEALYEVARRSGLSGAQGYEFLAELRATIGDCESARAAFDEALRIRARSAMEAFDLELGSSYRLPEVFVRECGLTGTTLPDGAPNNDEDTP